MSFPLKPRAALAVSPRQAVWLDETGAAERLSHAEAARRLQGAGCAPYVCHARATARRLGVGSVRAPDLLELFAFVHPARFTLPTARGLARALGLAEPATVEEEAAVLPASAAHLLTALAAPGFPDAGPALAIARAMEEGGWPWGEAVLAAFQAGGQGSGRSSASALAVWSRLGEWRESAPPSAPSHRAVKPAEARSRLAALLGEEAEPRPEQADFASAACAALEPAAEEGPHLVLAEAGTGVGKTLGYIAPMSVWVEKNGATAWLSTYTRNLQRQIDRELDRLYPDPAIKAERVVVRKGRENYLCLLNLEEAVGRSALSPADRAALGLMARWTAATRDGDMTGGDFPAWLADLLGYRLTLGLADRRGECIFSACTHFRRCFIEKGQRKARRADFVIANHALVMVQAVRAMRGGDDRGVPTRYVFDEGHHVFDAADGAFSAHLTGMEAAEVRRWILGAESRGRGARADGLWAGRARGLESRIGDLLAERADAREMLDDALAAARALPGAEWHRRIVDGRPAGPAERFLDLVRRQVLARTPGRDSPYGLETPVHPPVSGLMEAAAVLALALEGMERPLRALAALLTALLGDEAERLESAERQRIEGAIRGVEYRASDRIGAWRAMLEAIGSPPEAVPASATPSSCAPLAPSEAAEEGGAATGFVDWFAIDRTDGRDRDIGMHRHYVDPGLPFARSVLARTQGALITSATLRDDADDDAEGWVLAEARTGGRHLERPPVRASVLSPFDYVAQTRVLAVTDVGRDDGDRIAGAYRALFEASGGGALGLFTAISRLRAIHGRIAGPLDEAGIPLWSQHVDPLNTTTLVEIFRAEPDACLLGTDAVRDGVDVPGRSLRLIVFDRVPWPRPNILHKARREAFGGRRYDEGVARLRIKQAYGRLIRRADDKGVFVMLDRGFPTRLASAFPAGVAPQRVGLAEAVRIVAAFVGPEAGGR